MNRRFCTTNAGWLIGVVIALAIAAGIFALVRLDTTGKKGSGLGEQFTYDISDLTKIDPNLILYEETASPINTGFIAAHGVAVGPFGKLRAGSDGSIYVAGDKAIRRFSESGQLLTEIELTDMPRCLAIADDGKIYIGMKDHVEVYAWPLAPGPVPGAKPRPQVAGLTDSHGKRLASWPVVGGGDKAVLTSIAVSKDDVFVADAGNRIVLRYDTAGKLINRIGEKSPERNIPGFVIPSPYFDLAVASDGLLRVTNPGRHRIEAYTFEGDLEFWWGEFSSRLEGFCGCCNPVNFAILPDDSFVTCEKGLVRVKIYNHKGNFVGVVAGPEQLVEGGASRVSEFGAGSGSREAGARAGGFDVAVDSRGRIFVLDTIKNVVRIFARKKAGQ